MSSTFEKRGKEDKWKERWDMAYILHGDGSGKEYFGIYSRIMSDRVSNPTSLRAVSMILFTLICAAW